MTSVASAARSAPAVASPARRLGRMCVLAAVVASVAGCVGMPDSGPAQEFTAAPQAPRRP